MGNVVLRFLGSAVQKTHIGSGLDTDYLNLSYVIALVTVHALCLKVYNLFLCWNTISLIAVTTLLSVIIITIHKTYLSGPKYVCINHELIQVPLAHL